MRKHFRRKHAVGSLIILIIVSACAVAAQHFGWIHMTQGVEQSQPGMYAIDHFVDGDTIAITMNGKVEKVRFIGVDTPETHKPNTPVQCYGETAAAHTKQAIGSGRVRLSADSESDNRDRYGRLLRYVYTQDGTLLNKEIINDGYGFAYTYFPFSKSDDFVTAETQAKNAHRGLWAACHPMANQYGGYTSNVVGQ